MTLQTTTSYAGSYIYKDNLLEMIFQPEGYIEPNSSVAQTSFNYAYQYKDHLGNVRLTYADSDGNGSIDPSSEIISEKNYYPFGLQHKGYNNDISANVNSMANKFGYGGKEYGEELGLDWYDIQARNYDPALGRWMNLDPLAEQMRRHSPYNYAFNNPLRFMDPDGMAPDDVIIRGELAQEHFDQLQSSVSESLDLTFDSDTGKVEATVKEGVTLEKGSKEEKLFNATRDENRTVEVVAEEKTKTFGPDGVPMAGGAFLGSEVKDDGSVVGTQLVNPKTLGAIDEHLEQPEGTGALHETLEGYIGTVNAPGAGPAVGKQGSAVYTPIHAEAAGLDSNFQNSPGTPVIERTRNGTYIHFNFTNKKGVTKGFSRSFKRKKGK